MVRWTKTVLLVQALILALGPPVVQAEHLELFDWSHDRRPLSGQEQPPELQPNPVLAPTSAAPALASRGETFTVHVRLPQGATSGPPGAIRCWLTTQAPGPAGEPIGQPTTIRYSLSVDSVQPGPRAGTLALEARVSAWPPRETYHLQVAGPGWSARQIHAVRVLGDRGQTDDFRFALLSDHQLMDPSGVSPDANLNNHAYPERGDDQAERMILQQVEELAFLDPDFAIHLGDLVYGLDYRREFAHTLELWWRQPLATFLVPGNHDGLALYAPALTEGWWRQALLSLRCARFVRDGQWSTWQVFQLLSCLFADLKKMLFQKLTSDGLDHWRRWLGPTDFSFDRGAVHFAGINSFAGSSKRRHAFVLGLGFLGLDLGVPMVDNYGGQLSPEQLGWLKSDLSRARRRGRRVVLFLHHDPRGNADRPWGRRYHANLPFPSEPLGLRTFQEWNFDGPEWDSDPDAGLAVESQTENSAVALLRIIADSVDVVFTGHLHADRDALFRAGEELVTGSGIRARREVRFVRVTAAAAAPGDPDGYWGYRLVRAGDQGLAGFRFDPGRNWASVPAGNLWIERWEQEGRIAVHNGLPRAVDGLLRVHLPDRVEGYRFSARAGGGAVRLLDVARSDGGRNIYYLRVHAPGVVGGTVPPPAGQEAVVRIRVRPARGNWLPRVAFEQRPARPVQGQPVGFDGTASRDPEGRPLVSAIWDFGDGHSQRGFKVEHVFQAAGTYRVGLMATDDCGATSRYATDLEVLPKSSWVRGPD